MSEATDHERAVELALNAARAALAVIGARAVSRDARQLVALVRRVDAEGHVGLLASHLEGVEPAQVAERIAVVTVLARVPGADFGPVAARRLGRPESEAELAALPPAERADALLTRHRASWMDLHEIALDAGSRHPADTLSEVEREAAAQLVIVGLTAVRADKDLAADLSAELRHHAGVAISTDEIHQGPPGRLLNVVRDRAPASPPQEDSFEMPRAPASESVVVQWAMSPQCVLRVFLHESEGVHAPASPGEPWRLEDGHQLVLVPAHGGEPTELDPMLTDKILHRDDVVELVRTAKRVLRPEG